MRRRSTDKAEMYVTIPESLIARMPPGWRRRLTSLLSEAVGASPTKVDLTREMIRQRDGRLVETGRLL